MISLRLFPRASRLCAPSAKRQKRTCLGQTKNTHNAADTVSYGECKRISVLILSQIERLHVDIHQKCSNQKGRVGVRYAQKSGGSLFLAVMLLLILTRDSFAYVDPGGGSFVFQLIVAGLIGAALAVKALWQNIKRLFSKLLSRN